MRSLSILALAAAAGTAVAQVSPFPGAGPGTFPGFATNDSSLTSCDSAAWPDQVTGDVLVPQQPDEELQEMLKEIDPARIEAIIRKLASFGTRHTLSQQNSTTRGIGASRDWLLEEFKRLAEPSNGRMTVELQSYIQQTQPPRILFPVNISNIVATMRGSEAPGRFYVVSGHYDSRNTDPNDYIGDAPGADDDASGVALAMELARIVATRDPKATMVFTAVAGEEQSLFGSGFQAQTYRNSSVDVQGMYTNDIIGASRGDRGQNDPFTIRLFAQGPPTTETTAVRNQRLTIGGENDSPARELGRFIAEVAANEYTEMNVGVIYRLDRYLRGGDHRSYLEAGYPAVRFTEPNEDFAHQHQQFGDLPEFCDFEFISRVAKVNLAAMWSQANAPGTPTGVAVNTSVLSNDSILKWNAGNETSLASYEVVWRPTNNPFWTNSVDVGRVNTVTLPISKDNTIFGVRAVGTNGYKSPASFPFPG
ncbi:Leucine aminopeptidase 1 [Sphaceloma murrayae]|uniref:Peptide hydrolase n=1 Tax=Sphaceloma murrayae TaxID=2082308 RepID=A0A2K1QPC0_9PEZI|nr:Leucine aminopeptidase 1 [Sphaceloma murrayae]